MDTDALSPTQREALSQLQALTNGGDAEVAIGVLESCGWDVQRAAEVIFDSHPSAPLSVSPPRNAPPSPPVNTFRLDDSTQGLLGDPATSRQFKRVTPTSSTPLALLVRPLRLILAVLAFPFHILRAFFRILRIPLPQLPVTLSSLTLYYRSSNAQRNRSGRLDPRAAAEQWVRTLEEETGAMCLSRARLRAGEGSSSSSVGPSTSTVTSRSGNGKQHDGLGFDAECVLPDFFIGSYEEFARTCARESDPKIGCVVIVSEEHDDDAEFKRATLTDPKFLHTIQENDILVWGGDIRDRDAWSASQKLQATTYPFVAFIALQPRRGPSSTRTNAPPPPTLTILSRHQGPSIPSATAPTSAQTLVNHLNDQLLPRVTPTLTRVRTQAVERESLKALEAAQRDRERSLRAEQDRAFEETKRKDKVRIEARIAEEKRLAREAKLAEEKALQEKQEQEREEAERRAWEDKRMAWRRWGRKGLVPREPRPGVVENGRGKTIRVGVRMPNGNRGVRFFGEGDSMSALYAFVDTLFIPEGAQYSSDLDPRSPPDGAEVGEAGLVKAMGESGKVGEEWWGFKLVLSYPRREIIWGAGKRLGDVEGVKGGGQLVVELVEPVKAPSSKGKEKARRSEDSEKVDDEYDGYDTEESE